MLHSHSRPSLSQHRYCFIEMTLSARSISHSLSPTFHSIPSLSYLSSFFHPSPFIAHPPSLILYPLPSIPHLSSLTLHPSPASLTLHPSPFIPHLPSLPFPSISHLPSLPFPSISHLTFFTLNMMTTCVVSCRFWTS